MPRILDNFPAFYAPLLPEYFRLEIAEEKRSTCSNCAMCASPEGSPPPTAVTFHPATKCCTRHPNLPNYAVGALLSDEDPALAEGKQRVAAMIAQRVGVWPTGMRSSNRHRLLEQNMDRRAFGQTPSLRCPYFNEGNGGSCSIWAYRPAVCASYFCKPVSGQLGQMLWDELKEYMQSVERELICYTTAKLQPEFLPISLIQSEGRSKLSREDLEELAPPEAEYAAAWGQWVGREQEYYKACYEAVRALSPQEFEGVIGHAAKRRMHRLHQRYLFASNTEPLDCVRYNPTASVRAMPNGEVAVSAYSEHDALVLSQEMFATLTEFTGEEPTTVVQQRLREQGRPVPEGALLLDLCHHWVLFPA